jgi:hypothetical protein
VTSGSSLPIVHIVGASRGRKVLYFAYIDLIVMLLREVGYDNVVSISMTRGGNGDWKVTSLLGADTCTAQS